MRSLWTKQDGGSDSDSEDEEESTMPVQAEDWPWVWALGNGVAAAPLEEKEVQVRQDNLPVEIIPGKLFLGDSRCARNQQRLEELGITAVLNMAAGSVVAKPLHKEMKECNIRYKAIEADDEVSYPLLDNHWEEAYEFLGTNDKERYLVHCVAGLNRSALVTCAYYMLTTKTPVLETVLHLRRQRGNEALANVGFQQQLVALARRHDLLGARPGTEGSLEPNSPPPMEEHLAEDKARNTEEEDWLN